MFDGIDSVEKVNKDMSLAKREESQWEDHLDRLRRVVGRKLSNMEVVIAQMSFFSGWTEFREEQRVRLVTHQDHEMAKVKEYQDNNTKERIFAEIQAAREKGDM